MNERKAGLSEEMGRFGSKGDFGQIESVKWLAWVIQEMVGYEVEVQVWCCSVQDGRGVDQSYRWTDMSHVIE
jgi:hypothetical protein